MLFKININENICWESVGYCINSSYINGVNKDISPENINK